MQSTQQSITLYTDDKDKYLHRLQYDVDKKITTLEHVFGSAQHAQANQSIPLSIDQNNPLEATVQRVVANLLSVYYQSTRLTQLPFSSSKPTQVAIDDLAWEAVQYGISYCAEREAAFRADQVCEVALTHALSECSPERIGVMLELAKKQGLLLSNPLNSAHQLWTTPNAALQEQQILAWAREGKHTQPAMASDTCVKAFLQKTALCDEQAQAIRQIATSTDRLILVQGAPGTGKTTLLHTLQQFLQAQNVLTQYLAPTHSAVRELNKGNYSPI